MAVVRNIDQIARVEGHGRLRLVQRQGRVIEARFELYESLRLFEALVVGRCFDEIPAIVCRICSICSTIHKVAALQTVEAALGVTVSPQTALLRQLAVQGGQIESHALHLFCLALPDYLDCGGLAGLARKIPHELTQGLAIKALGNQIQEQVGGRAIHPFNLLLGGMGTVPTRDRLQRLADDLRAAIAAAGASIALIAGLDGALPPLPVVPGCAVDCASSLVGTHLATTDGVRIGADDAYDWLDEQLTGTSTAKVSNFGGKGPYLVGPLARLNLNAPLEPAAKAAFRHHRSALIAASPAGSNLARTIELLQAVERAGRLIDELLQNGLHPEQPVSPQVASGSATVLCEAPRGLLLHQYRFDADGRCTAAQVVTPTAINQRALKLSLAALVDRLPAATADEFRLQAERLVRCFDPCISCAVH